MTHSKLDEKILLPMPELLPTRRVELSTLRRQLADAGFDLSILRMAATGDTTGPRVLISHLYDQFVRPTVEPHTSGWSRQSREQDSFFGVIRVDGNTAGILICGVFLAFVEALGQACAAGSSLTAAEWEQLLAGPAAMLHYYVGSPAATSSLGHLAPSLPRTPAPAGEPWTQWEIGHRLFFTLTQCITVALSCFASEYAADNTGQSVLALNLATTLVRAAAMSMRFASDFPAADYHADVRLSMRPPHVSPGFSGVMGRDHQVLVSLLRRLRPIFGTFDRDPATLDEFRAATRGLFTAHELVCSKFGGDDKPSLLMETRGTCNPTETASTVARRLSQRRLTLIGSPTA
jgi:hypothetical protein